MNIASYIKPVELATSIRALAAGLPTFVYETPDGQKGPGVSCQYAHGDTAGCIVGHALHAHGVPLEWFAQHEGTAARKTIELWNGTEQFAPEDVDALEWIGWVQQLQDAGWDWGHAVDFADIAVAGGNVKRYVTTTHYDEQKKDWIETTHNTTDSLSFARQLSAGPEHVVSYGDAIFQEV